MCTQYHTDLSSKPHKLQYHVTNWPSHKLVPSNSDNQTSFVTLMAEANELVNPIQPAKLCKMFHYEIA